MRKFTKIAASALFILALIPASASAHNDNNGRGQARGWHFGWGKHQEKNKRNVNVSGAVTAVASPNITLKAKDGTVFTIVTNASTKFEKPFGSAIVFADVKVNDNVAVKGTRDSTTITAVLVIDTPQNTHAARATGKVTAVSGNTVTVQANHTGVISNITVKTDATTAVTKADGNAGALADVTVGSTVKVKGLWDEVTSVLNAVKVRIK